MRIEVKYMAQLRQAAGTGSVAIEMEAPCTVRDLLLGLPPRHGDAFRAIILDKKGGLYSSLLLFVGDEQVRTDSPRPLRDGDVVTLLAPMAGG